jgi:hypothetical protein
MSGKTEKIAAADPFDLESLRLSQDFGTQLGVKKLLTRVPVRKPTKQEFVRVHPSPAYRLETMVLELKSENETYLVPPDMQQELLSDIVPVRLFTAITRQGVVILWPCKLPGIDGRTNPWHQTALEAASLAQESWVKVVANMHLGGYETYVAEGTLPDPEWPDLTLQELLRIAFRDRLIDRPDHPVVAQLLGRA